MDALSMLRQMFGGAYQRGAEVVSRPHRARLVGRRPGKPGTKTERKRGRYLEQAERRMSRAWLELYFAERALARASERRYARNARQFLRESRAAAAVFRAAEEVGL